MDKAMVGTCIHNSLTCSHFHVEFHISFSENCIDETIATKEYNEVRKECDKEEYCSIMLIVLRSIIKDPFL